MMHYPAISILLILEEFILSANYEFLRNVKV